MRDLHVRVYTQRRCHQCRATLLRFMKRGAWVEEAPAVEHLDFLHGLGLTMAPGVVVSDGDEILDSWGGFIPSKVDQWARELRLNVGISAEAAW